jgi:CheY-like chemotaxis protein
MVDADPLILMNLVVMLEDRGHDVTEATSGHTALETYIANENWDLVITDHSIA